MSQLIAVSFALLAITLASLAPFIVALFPRRTYEPKEYDNTRITIYEGDLYDAMYSFSKKQ